MFTSDYLKLPHLCFDKKMTVFKNMTIILVEIVTLDAFWSEKSTICQRNLSPPEANVALIVRHKMAYLRPRCLKKIIK